MDQEKLEKETRYQSSMNEMRAQIATFERQVKQSAGQVEQEARAEQAVLVDLPVENVDTSTSEKLKALQEREDDWNKKEKHLVAAMEKLRKENSLLITQLQAKSISLGQAEQEKRSTASQLDRYKVKFSSLNR
ncbi:hypothetical protein Ciccas_011985 [Cichlidogyrus casuarinus]|uniref:Uncharacterized protein n=1 Tax=Cichlidogyrus casuarinus TaxID=1844966 RepID=A0ABD2PPP4_9PLAT